MDLRQHGVDRSVIALWLGHESVETTAIYLQADMQRDNQVESGFSSRSGSSAYLVQGRRSLGCPVCFYGR
ncbi:hypothetical protein ACSGFO_32370 [Mesorhizobium sp. WSM4083]|uniref:hypothetical protein n=1 Tax=Mesorhizobium TaxID=68287 RepID=UPI001AEEA688|nr:hypothetical protein [Mesorhizobium neociceri]